jgi:queuosine precursor transporter
MTNSEKIYTGLCIAFVLLIILGNLVYQKFVRLQVFSFHTFELSVGAILYPMTILITDLITEFYGRERARFCIRFAMLMNVFVILIISFMDYLPATSWSKIDDQTFHKVFGYYGVAFFGSMIACYIAQVVDVRLYLLIRYLTKGKYLWIRSNVSTGISLFIDTSVVISFMTLFGIFEINQMSTLILNSYSWKLFFTICSTPLFYLCFLSIRYFIGKDKDALSKTA